MNKQQFQALPEAQRLQLQERLQEQGFYQDEIDGVWGPATAAAFKAQELSQAQDQGPTDNEVRLKELELAGDEREEQQEEKAEQESPIGIARRVGATLGAPLAGYGLGRWGIGGGLNYAADKAQEARNESLAKAAENRRSGLATRDGALAGAQRSGALPPRNSFLRIGGRMLPHTIAGGGMIGKGAAVMAGMEENAPPVREDTDMATALGLMGTGAGILERGAGYATSPGVSPDAGDISIIESNQLRRNAQASPMAQALAGDQAREITPPQTPTEGRTALPAPEEAEAQGQSVRRSDRAKELTRVANVKGRSKLNKAEALNAVRETVEKDQKARTAVAKKLSEMGYDTKPGPKYLERISKALDDLGPKGAAAIAGLVAYDAIRGDAEAADGEQSGGSMAEALLGSTAAGGAAYGGMKGLEKAGELAARYAPGAMRMLGRAAGPVGAGLTAYDAYNAFQNADIDPGPKYPTTRDIASAYRQQQMPDPREAGTGRQASPMVRALMNRR